MKKISKWISLVLLVLSASVAYSQDNDQPTTFILSGFVLDKNTKEPLQAVSVLNPNAGTGVLTNQEGGFAIKVSKNDSLLLREVGYQSVYYKIPAEQTSSYTITLLMTETIEQLSPVQVFPYADERSFKNAFLKMDPLSQEEKNLRKNLSKDKIEKLSEVAPNDSQITTQRYLKDEVSRTHNQTFAPTLQLVNPFAWVEFFKTIKQQKEAKKKEEQEKK